MNIHPMKYSSKHIASLLGVLFSVALVNPFFLSAQVRDTASRRSAVDISVKDTLSSVNSSVIPSEEDLFEDLTSTDHSSLVFPAPSEIRTIEEEPQFKVLEDEDGNQWRMYQVDDMVIGVSVKRYQDYGKWFRIDYYVLNEGDKDKFFDFSSATVKSPDGRAKLYSYDEFMRKSRRRHFWSSFGVNVAIYTTGIILDEALNGDYFRGRADEYSLGRDIAHEVSSAVLSGMSVVGVIAADGYFSDDMRRVYSENIGYVRDYTIKPGYAIEGHAFARYSKRGELTVNVPISGRVYSMRWDTTSIETLKRSDSR